MTCADRKCSLAGHQCFSALESYVLEALGGAPSLGAEGCGVILGQTSQVWAGSVPCSGSCAGDGFLAVPYLRARAPKARQQPWVVASCLGLGPGGSGVFWISASQLHARPPLLSAGHQHLMREPHILVRRETHQCRAFQGMPGQGVQDSPSWASAAFEDPLPQPRCGPL